MCFNYLDAVVFYRLLNVQSDSCVTSLVVCFSSSIEELGGRGNCEIASNVTRLFLFVTRLV